MKRALLSLAFLCLVGCVHAPPSSEKGEKVWCSVFSVGRLQDEYRARGMNTEARCGFLWCIVETR